jgi:multisubunit Na+/H+ antiporter MnhG subunit
MTHVSLSSFAIGLGLVFALPAVFGLTAPDKFRNAMREFPRSNTWGWFLMLLGTAWFVYNVGQEQVADFQSYKKILLTFFAGVGIASCIFVRDFLAVRGAAVVMLLLAKGMVDTGRPLLGASGWVVLWQAWAYVFVVAGIWLTVSPWRLRDLIHWATADERRIRITCGARLAFCLLIVLLGATVYRTAQAGQ